jgi:hypothetical protein
MAQAQASGGKWVDQRQSPDQIRARVAQPNAAVVIIVAVDGTIEAFPMQGTTRRDDPIPGNAQELNRDNIGIRVTSFNPNCTTTTIGGTPVTVCK